MKELKTMEKFPKTGPVSGRLYKEKGSYSTGTVRKKYFLSLDPF
jgi:hypothetical protein